MFGIDLNFHFQSKKYNFKLKYRIDIRLKVTTLPNLPQKRPLFHLYFGFLCSFLERIHNDRVCIISKRKVYFRSMSPSLHLMVYNNP